MGDCLFCKIAVGEIPSDKLYEDDICLAFYDVEPMAPVHFLVVPKQHIESAGAIDNTNSDVVAHIFEVISLIAKNIGLDEGFRVVSNVGEQAGQSIKHIHFHVLAKRNLEWPPG